MYTLYHLTYVHPVSRGLCTPCIRVHTAVTSCMLTLILLIMTGRFQYVVLIDQITFIENEMCV